MPQNIEPVDRVRQLVTEEKDAKLHDYARQVITGCLKEIEQLEGLEEEIWSGFSLPAFEMMEYSLSDTLSFIESTRRDLSGYLTPEEALCLQKAAEKYRDLMVSLSGGAAEPPIMPKR